VRISALAKLSGTQAETIRYYERVGLLSPPARTCGNYRDFGERHRKRLVFIRHCRTLGMSLAEVRMLLVHKDSPHSECDEVAALVARHLDETSRRIQELQSLQGELLSLGRRCSQGRPSSRCGILGSIERAAESAAKEAAR